MSTGAAKESSGANAGVRVDIQARATGSQADSEEQLNSTKAANCAGGSNTASSGHAQGTARQPKSGRHTAPPCRSSPQRITTNILQAGVQEGGMLHRIVLMAGQLHHHIAPVSVPLVLSGVVGSILGKLHQGMAGAVEDWCLANVPDEEVVAMVRRLIYVRPDANVLNVELAERKLQLAKGLCSRYMAVVRNALREAELNLRFSYVPANDAHLFYVPNLDPDCLKVFRKAHECVPSIWGELHKGGNTRQGGMPPASLGDALYQLPALVLPGVRNSLRELGKLNPIVSQGCNSAHAEIVRMEARYLEAIAEYHVCAAKHTDLVEEVCEFEGLLALAAGGPMYAGMAAVHRQAAHGQNVEEGTNGEMRNGRADAAANSWASRNRES